MATAETRERPNILITGAPGTGKSTLGQIVADRLEFEFLEVGKEARENNLYEEFDSEYQCHVLDEERLLDHIEERMDSETGGVVVDYHGCDFFPQRWFDVVVVLRTDNTVLYDRLAARGYPEFKIRENVECEIFGSLLEEAMDSYDESVVHEMRSDALDDMERNADRICELAQNWKTECSEMTE